VQQCHRITDTINKALEDQQYYTAVFLDISQAFDKVWHPGLLYKIKKNPAPRLLQPPEIIPTRQTLCDKI